MRRLFVYTALISLAAACSDSGSASSPAKTTGTDSTLGGFEILVGSDIGSGPDTPDASGGDTDGSTPGQDANTVDPGTFGAPCIENKDCNTGLCVPSAGGFVCTQSCVEDCPTGFKCTLKTSGTDSSYICLPGFTTLCDPCHKNADCNDAGETANLCVAFGNDGSFCGAACGPGKPACPNDYECSTIVDEDTGKQAKQCQPKSLQCTCSAAAVAKSASTTCANSNPYGKCGGVRTCSPAGLSDCAGPVPKAEDCNGIDDDCNGQTDDFDVTAKCSKTNEFGKCSGVLTACVEGVPQCDAPTPTVEQCNGLDDDCDGLTDNVSTCEDGNPCTKDSCNSGGGCQHAPQSGLVCDDGNSCTQEDKCSQGGCTGGKPLGCDDGDPCTLDGCDALGGCVHTAQDGSCTDDGNACTQDVCISGKCSHPPTAEGGTCLEDGDACTQDVCVTGKCTHPAVKDTTPCTDDGNPCTSDACTAGKCAHPPVSFTLACAEDGNECTADVCDKGSCTHQTLGADKSCLEDGDPCTQDVCLSGKCSHPPAANNAPCLDDGLLCTTDVCVSGKCKHNPSTGAPCADDNLPCTADICDNTGACSHPPKDGPPCADEVPAQPCTSDFCQGGKCAHIYNDSGCDDSDPCTLIDKCNLGVCKGYNLPNCDDGNDCTNDKCQKGQGCVHVPSNGYVCNDGNKCTTSDFCQNGQCVGTGGKNCDDGNACTTDACDAGGGCTHVNNSAGCDDDSNPCTTDICQNGTCAHPSVPPGGPCGASGNPCLAGVCNAGKCELQPTQNVCDDGNACTANDKCANGSCAGSAFKNCDDGNPCTQDSCDKYGTCTHDAADGKSCTAPSGDCPIGKCAGGSCQSTPGVTCQAKQKTDLCGSVLVPGTCAGNGKCVSSTSAPGFSCPGCNGICVACTIFGGLQIKYCLAF
jgi:hypothetical protein